MIPGAIAAALLACATVGAPPLGTPLPGAPARDPALDRRLWAAVGPPTEAAPYVNRLALEASPYLRVQHARDPVDWYPWGPDAFAAAKAADKLVLLSIGYATCHWCHVMGDESFRDTEIARAINARFVAIKVDREARPDVDAVYLEAAQVMTGRPGGWPLTLVLTPDGRPVFAATYLPARDGDRGAAVGLLTVLDRMANGWANDRDALIADADQVSRQLAILAHPEPPGQVPGDDVVSAAVERLRAGYDAEHGGFGARPKFPRVPALELLLGVAARAGDLGTRDEALGMVVHTVDQMDVGAIHDAVGGGFHRYAVDTAWSVPHFEKITAENAGIAVLLARLAAATGEPRYAALARETLSSLAAAAVPGGGYGTALDADSEGNDGVSAEGAYYTWTRAELDAALGPSAGFAATAYQVGDGAGPIAGRYALDPVGDLAAIAAATGTPESDVSGRLATIRTTLGAVRAARPRPLLDDKVLSSVTGRVLSAYARAATDLGDPEYAGDVAQLVATLDRARRPDGRMAHALGDPADAPPGSLEDQVYVAEGLLDAFAAAPDPALLRWALALMDQVDRRYADPSGGWYDTADDAENLLFRPRSGEDGPEPSGAAVAVRVDLRLAALTGDPRWTERADKALAAYADLVRASPISAPSLLEAGALRRHPPPEIVIAWPSGADPAPLLAEARRHDLPGRVWIAGPNETLAALAGAVPLVDGKLDAGAPTAWVCEGGVCQRPSVDAAGLRAAIAAATAGSAHQ